MSVFTILLVIALLLAVGSLIPSWDIRLNSVAVILISAALLVSRLG